MQQITQTAKET